MPSVFSKIKKRLSISSDSEPPLRSSLTTSSTPVVDKLPQSPTRAGARSSLDLTRTSRDSHREFSRSSLDLRQTSKQPQQRQRIQQPSSPISNGSRAEIIHDQPPTIPDFSVGSEYTSKPNRITSTHSPSDPSRARFQDEIIRPELPTTISNVDNPEPDSNSLTWKPAHTNHIGNTNNKSLPTLPEASPALPLLPGSENDKRELDPSSSSHLSSSSPLTLPPLPHIESIDATHVSPHQPRPDIIPSGSATSPSQAHFRHLNSLSPSSSNPRSPETNRFASSTSRYNNHNDASTSRPQRSGETRRSRKSLDADAIPPRHSSLSRRSAASQEALSRRSSSSSNYSDHPQKSPRGDDKLTAQGDTIAVLSPLDAHLAKLAFGQGGRSSKPFKSLHDPNALPLEDQRSTMIDAIVAGARKRRELEGGLSDAGIKVFSDIGWGEKVGHRGEVEVRSKWLKPVVQQNIIRKEHTEITTIIERCIHKTHIYPIIQPIHDPDPIRHPTRHRFYDATTGKWHEVIGDEAAIAIIGEEIFKNGPKEYREERKLALPGFDGPLDETFSRGMLEHNSEGRVVPITRRDGNLEDHAFRARIIEREGVEGKMGDWKDLSTGEKVLNVFKGRLGRGGSNGEFQGDEDEMEMVGEVDGLVDGLGERLIRVSI